MVRNTVKDYLEKERDRLREIIHNAEKTIERSPEGSVQIKKHKRGFQFYHRKGSREKNGTYLPVSEREKAYALVQKRYLERILRTAEKQEKVIDEFLRRYDPDSMKRVFCSEDPIRQGILDPIDVPDALYEAEWQAVAYEKKGFPEGMPVHYTGKGEQVRSKSEVLIANALYQAGIPYRYEYPLKIRGHLVYPDFTILRSGDRKELFWEHFGLLDDTEYRNNMLRKMEDYAGIGCFPGDRVIVTGETYRVPLNLQTVERMIEHYLL